MQARTILHLKNHRLTHLRDLRVDPLIFDATFSHGCSMQNCNATCCQDGVTLDIAERDRILDSADLVRRHMEPGQEHNSDHWFDPEEEDTSRDFPSGRVSGTQATERGCVFLKSDGRCVLQTAAEEEGLDKHSLKPFFCFAFPITLDSGVLTVDDPDFTNRTECCSVTPDGKHSVMDVCSEELEFVLGREGFDELQSLARNRA